MRLLRPLLGFRRADLRAYCFARSLPFVDDPSNVDPRFRRNRVRHELLPLLEDIAPGAGSALARLAELAADDQAVLAAAVDAVWTAVVERPAADAVAVGRTAFRRLLPAVQRGVLRRIGVALLGPAPDLSFERLEAARVALLRGRGGAVVEWPDGARLTVAGQRGIFAKERT